MTTTTAAATSAATTNSSTLTTSSSKNSNVIPKWAKIRKQQHNHDHVTTAKSESYYRVQSALKWKHILQHAKTIAWNQLVKDALSSKRSQQQNKQPRSSSISRDDNHDKLDDDDENDAASRQMLSAMTSAVFSSSSSSSNSSSSPSSSFPFELLPCTCLIPPTSCIWDRHTLAEALVKSSSRSNGIEFGEDTTSDDDENLVSGGGGGGATTTKTTTAVLWIPRFLSSFHATLSLLLDQILRLPSSQEPRSRTSRLFHRYTKKNSKKKRSASIQDAILLWASETTQYQRIQIIVQDPAGQERVQEAFLHALQEWRSVYGLPVSLVVILPNNPNLSTSSQASCFDVSNNFGRYGMRLRYIRLDANQWISHFWAELLPKVNNYNNNEGGTRLSSSMPISSTVFRRLGQQYTQEYGSLSRWVQESLHQSITQFYAMPGSFVWDVISSSSSSAPPSSISSSAVQEWRNDSRFLAWCCTYSTAKSSFSSSSSSLPMTSRDKYQALCECEEIQSSYNIWYCLQIQSFLLRTKTMMTTTSSRDVGGDSNSNNYYRLSILADIHHTLLSLLQPSSSSQKKQDMTIMEKEMTRASSFKMLRQYLKRGPKLKGTAAYSDDDDDARDATVSLSSFSDTSNELKLLSLVNELIVLLDESCTSQPHQDQERASQTSSSSMVETGIAQMIDQLDRGIGKEMDRYMGKWKGANPLYDNTREIWEDGPNHHLDEDGYQTTTRPIVLRREIIDNLSNPARAMYALLENRLSITRDEWFHACGANTDHFSVGVWTLSACGLIQAKWGRGGKLLFEKVSVVWC